MSTAARPNSRLPLTGGQLVSRPIQCLTAIVLSCQLAVFRIAEFYHHILSLKPVWMSCAYSTTAVDGDTVP